MTRILAKSLAPRERGDCHDTRALCDRRPFSVAVCCLPKGPLVGEVNHGFSRRHPPAGNRTQNAAGNPSTLAGGDANSQSPYNVARLLFWLATALAGIVGYAWSTDKRDSSAWRVARSSLLLRRPASESCLGSFLEFHGRFSRTATAEVSTRPPHHTRDFGLMSVFRVCRRSFP